MNRNSFMKAAAALLSIPLFGNEKSEVYGKPCLDQVAIMGTDKVLPGNVSELIYDGLTIDAYKDDFGELFDRHGKSINHDFNLSTYKANLKTGKVNYYLTKKDGKWKLDKDGNCIEGVKYFDAPLLFVRDAELTREKMQQMRDLING